LSSCSTDQQHALLLQTPCPSCQQPMLRHAVAYVACMLPGQAPQHSGLSVGCGTGAEDKMCGLALTCPLCALQLLQCVLRLTWPPISDPLCKEGYSRWTGLQAPMYAHLRAIVLQQVGAHEAQRADLAGPRVCDGGQHDHEVLQGVLTALGPPHNVERVCLFDLQPEGSPGGHKK
jgi:hypothetical protein